MTEKHGEEDRRTGEWSDDMDMGEERERVRKREREKSK